MQFQKLTTIAATLENSPWWLYSTELPENCPKMSALASRLLLMNDGLKIRP
jgi:hypothetical protein